MTMLRELFIFCCFLFVSVVCKNIGHDLKEEGRLFGITHTKTVIETQRVTSLVPSSCIEVSPTLSACRNVRFLNFPQITTGFSFSNWTRTDNVTSASNPGPELRITTTPLSWGERLGIFAPTVTVTTTDTQVTVLEDPSVVVTFSVVSGCKPLDLPVGIDLCSSNSNQEIQPSSIVQDIPSTALPNIEQPSNSLEPSMQGPSETSNLQATSNL